MNVLYLGDDKADSGCHYYDDNVAVVRAHHRVWCYGRGHPWHDPADRIEDVLAKCPFEPQVVVLGQSWEKDEDLDVFDPHPAIELGHLDLPVVMFLNKEYKKLEYKLEYIARNRVDVVLSTIRGIVDTAPDLGARFVFFPFPVDTDRFQPAAGQPEFDVGFAGSLHLQYTSLRYRIRQQLDGPEYGGLRVYWGDYQRGGTMTPRDYVTFARRCRVSLCTPSGCDGIGTRFFEIMASGSLLFCPRSPEYPDFFEPGEHCITFAADLSDFRQRLLWILNDDAERARITSRALAHVRHYYSIPATAMRFDRVLVEQLGLTTDSKALVV